MTDTCEKHCEANAFKIVIRGLEGEIVRLKERLAQEKALQALHDENERLGLYRDAYSLQEPVATVTSETGADIAMSWWHEPALPIGTKLYATPPQRTEPLIDQSAAIRIATVLGWTPPRTWVGLKEEDYVLVNQLCMNPIQAAEFVDRLLKEKNT